MKCVFFENCVVLHTYLRQKRNEVRRYTTYCTYFLPYFAVCDEILCRLEIHHVGLNFPMIQQLSHLNVIRDYHTYDYWLRQYLAQIENRRIYK